MGISVTGSGMRVAGVGATATGPGFLDLGCFFWFWILGFKV